MDVSNQLQTKKKEPKTDISKLRPVLSDQASQVSPASDNYEIKMWEKATSNIVPLESRDDRLQEKRNPSPPSELIDDDADVLCQLNDLVHGRSSFCIEDNQCLVDPNGNFEDNNNPELDPQCITDGQYINDNYCENGIWTSRTKYIALQFLDIARGNDYTIFCDEAQKTLNELKYVIGETELVENLVVNQNINN